jgi:hypothetical protein
MQFDIDKMAAMDRYELLLSTIMPRPIALVTSISRDGSINAAPYRRNGFAKPRPNNDLYRCPLVERTSNRGEDGP